MGEHGEQGNTYLAFCFKVCQADSMKRIKPKGKTVRLPPGAERMLQALREKMEKTISVCGVRVAAGQWPSDGVVLGWSLSLACMVSNPRLVVIDREVFLKRLDENVEKRLAALGEATPEERRAMLELLVAGSCDVSPYDTSAPLRAAPTEGGEPS